MSRGRTWSQPAMLPDTAVIPRWIAALPNPDVYDRSRRWACVSSECSVPSVVQTAKVAANSDKHLSLLGGLGGYWLHSRCQCVNQSLDSNKKKGARLMWLLGPHITAIVFQADTSQKRSCFKTFFFLKLRDNYYFHLHTGNIRSIFLFLIQNSLQATLLNSRKVGQCFVVIWKPGRICRDVKIK